MEGRGRRLWRGFNDLQTLFPEVATFWGPSNDLEPSEFLPTSNAKVWWICDLGHEYDAKIWAWMTSATCLWSETRSRIRRLRWMQSQFRCSQRCCC